MNLNAPVWPHQPSRSTFPQALPSQHLQILNPESQIQQQLEQTKFQSMPQRNQIRPHIPQPADISAGIRFHKPAKRAEASVLPLSEALGAGLLEDYKELKHLEAIILRTSDPPRLLHCLLFSMPLQTFHETKVLHSKRPSLLPLPAQLSKVGSSLPLFNHNLSHSRLIKRPLGRKSPHRRHRRYRCRAHRATWR